MNRKRSRRGYSSSSNVERGSFHSDVIRWFGHRLSASRGFLIHFPRSGFDLRFDGPIPPPGYPSHWFLFHEPFVGWWKVFVRIDRCFTRRSPRPIGRRFVHHLHPGGFLRTVLLNGSTRFRPSLSHAPLLDEIQLVRQVAHQDGNGTNGLNGRIESRCRWCGLDILSLSTGVLMAASFVQVCTVRMVGWLRSLLHIPRSIASRTGGVGAIAIFFCRMAEASLVSFSPRCFSC